MHQHPRQLTVHGPQPFNGGPAAIFLALLLFEVCFYQYSLFIEVLETLKAMRVER